MSGEDLLRAIFIAVIMLVTMRGIVWLCMDTDRNLRRLYKRKRK